MPWLAASPSPSGFWPFAAPTPETSVPAPSAPARSGTLPSTPVSITATFTPAPRVVCQAVVKP